MADITHMIRTNLKSNHIQIENLCKSIFSDMDSIKYNLEDKKIIVHHNDSTNPDAASIEFVEYEDKFSITYWDGYSLAEDFESNNIKDALKAFKRFSKKLYKNISRFG